MDVFDQATFNEERDTALSVKHIRAQAGPIKVTGFCLSEQCKQPIANGRWCDSWCKEDWDRDQRIRQIMGR